MKKRFFAGLAVFAVIAVLALMCVCAGGVQ